MSLVKAVSTTDHHVVAVGRKTKYFLAIKEFMDTHKMNDRIHFIEDVLLEELAGIYQLSELMVYTSLVEGFGIPIIESLYTSHLSSVMKKVYFLKLLDQEVCISI